MKSKRILMSLFVLAFIMVWSYTVVAEQKSITLPKGTKVEKVGPGHFKFKLPDGQAVEVKNFSRSGGKAIIGDCGIYDRTGKLIASGKQGNLKSGPKPTGGKVEYLKIESKEHIKIDDDITWLPATITFQVETKTKGLSPQPDPPGKK